MTHRPKKNTVGEDEFAKDLLRHGSLEMVDRGESQILSLADYPEPLKRFLARERGTIRVRLPASHKRKLERLSRATGISVDKLARRWVEQGLAREAG